jgi:hypothetical protein
MTPMASPMAKASSWSCVTNSAVACAASGCRAPRGPGARAGPHPGWKTARPAAAAAGAAPARGPAPRAAAGRRRVHAGSALGCRPAPPVPAPRPRARWRSARGRLWMPKPRSAHIQVREQRVVLEHHANAPLLGRRAVPALPTTCLDQADLAGGHRLQPGHGAQQVVLPQPDGPISTPMSPARRPNDTPSTAACGCDRGTAHRSWETSRNM